MRGFYALACAITLLLITSGARAESYDATRDYACGDTSGRIWSYEGYRAEDGAYLPMVLDHVPIREVSRYGVDARYIPDSGQPYYPFLTKLTDYLMCSPVTRGKRYDAVLTWAAPRGGDVVLSGFVRLMGNIKGEAPGKKVKAFIVLNGKALWSADLNDVLPREFKVRTGVAAGDRVHLHIQNAGDESGNITAVNMSVETVKK